MTLRQSLLLASGVCLVITSSGCGPQVDAESPDVSGSSTTTGSETSGPTPATSGSGPVDPGQTQGVTTAVPGSSSDGGESTGLPTNADGSSGSESSTGSPATLDCTPLCESLIEGSCLGEQDACALTCEMTVREQGPAVEAAFATCVATEYLCFSLVEDCIWSELYGPKAVEQHYIFEGEGFDAWNGQTVFAQFTGGTETSTTEAAVVLGGEVVVEGTLTTTLERFGNSRNVRLFVDVNGDGSCTPGIDHAQSVWLQGLGSAFDELIFVIPATPTEMSSDGLCDLF